jgi:hypothetical protein
MLKTTGLIVASAMLLVAAPAAAQNGRDDSYGYQQSDDGDYGPGPDADQNAAPMNPRHGGNRLGLTPDQRALWKADMRRQVQDMPHEQRRAYRQQMRQQFLAMSPQERQQKLASLQGQQSSYGNTDYGANNPNGGNDYQNDAQDNGYQAPRRHRHRHQAQDDQDSQNGMSQNEAAVPPSRYNGQQYGDRQYGNSTSEERQYGQSRAQQPTQNDNNDDSGDDDFNE